MNDACKHLQKKGMSYKDKKDLLKSFHGIGLVTHYPFSSALTNTTNLNDDVDFSALFSAYSHIFESALMVHRLKNDNEFNKFLEEFRKENQE